jgi:hypothetical protein
MSRHAGGREAEQGSGHGASGKTIEQQPGEQASTQNREAEDRPDLPDFRNRQAGSMSEPGADFNLA